MKKRVIILGKKVHNIGYRPFLLGIAESLGIKRFYAENVFIDRTQAVEVLIEDKNEKVKAFVELIKKKTPETAIVDKIEERAYDGNVMKIEAYYRYLSATQLTNIATIGGSMLEKQDTMIEKQDTMIEKQDKMLEKQDTMLGKMDSLLEKQDRMLEKQDETISVIKEEGEKTRDALKEHLARDIARLYEEIDEIKATLARVVEKVGA